jgi:SAM-dependent methyltransferase
MDTQTNTQAKFGPDFYDHEYFDGTGKSAYGGYGPGLIWDIFTPLATELDDLFRPNRVLDLGCAKGYLVSCFRRLGVKAYGFDISEYAVNSAPANAKKYVCQASIDSIPFPDKYFDLVVSTDVMEHLTLPQAEAAIREIQRVSSRFVYTNICLDLEPGLAEDSCRSYTNDDKSHITVAPRGFWNRRFREQGFIIREDLEERIRATDIWKKVKWEIFVLQQEGSSERVEWDGLGHALSRKVGHLENQVSLARHRLGIVSLRQLVWHKLRSVSVREMVRRRTQR